MSKFTVQSKPQIMANASIGVYIYLQIYRHVKILSQFVQGQQFFKENLGKSHGKSPLYDPREVGSPETSGLSAVLKIAGGSKYFKCCIKIR